VAPTVEPQKILVVRLKAIGDVIMATPVFRALRKAFPSAQLHFVTNGVNEPLVRHNPHLNRILLYPSKTATLPEKLHFLSAIRREKYDWVFDLEATPRSAWLTLATGAKERVGYAFRIRKWAFNHPVPKNQVRRFQADVCLSLTRHLGVQDTGLQTEIFFGKEEKDWAEDYFQRPDVSQQRWKIAFNPTGSWVSKQWPIRRWRELVTLIGESLGVKPLLFWGPGSENLVEQIQKGLEDKILLQPKTGLLQAAAYIKKLDLLIGTDGTPQHMAQALGTPSLTLCGPTWGIGYTLPGDARHRYLQHFLDCGPCDFTTCPFPEREEGKTQEPAHYQRECLDRISPTLVLQTAKEILKIS